MKKLEKFKKFLEEKVILSAVMCILLAVVLITATYTWYTLNNTPKMYGLELSTGGSGGLIVAIEPGGEDIMSARDLERIEEDGKVIAMIPINLGSFENIEEGLIAPGAYGPLPFYITSQSASIRSYELKVQFVYEPSETETADMTDEEKEALQEKAEYVENMIMDHFTIYQTKYTEYSDREGKDIVRFKDPLTFYKEESDNAIAAKGSLLPINKEVPVELWWVWNYELTDIPEYWNIERFTYVDDEDGSGLDLSVDENGKAINEIDTRKAVRKYDEEDTELGNYLNDIYFNVYVIGSPSTVQ